MAKTGLPPAHVPLTACRSENSNPARNALQSTVQRLNTPPLPIPNCPIDLGKSNLPFSVDLLERCDAGAEFLSRIENEGMVELNSMPAEHP